MTWNCELDLETGRCRHCHVPYKAQPCAVNTAIHADDVVESREIPAEVGWGDRTEQVLASLGITQDWYREIKERFGLLPTCYCPQRKAYLNRVGRWWKSKMARKNATANPSE